MVLGRLVHYSIDAILISTVIAGVRRSSGFAPETPLIPDATIRSVADRYLGFGETVFDMLQATAVNSKWWKRDGRR